MHPRVQASGGARTRGVPLAERVLRFVAADAKLVEAVLGDLSEEYASRVESDGTWIARMWYAREALRSAPHVLLDALRRASHGARLRLAACVALGILMSYAVAAARQARAAAALDPEDGAGVVVNSVRPVRLPVRVRDATGRTLRSTDVRFRWVSGAPLAVAPNGVATCPQAGDATVRASLGALSADLLVHCRPVRDVYGPAMLDLVVGDSARDVPFAAVGADGHAVTLLAGRLTVRDSGVATLEGPRIRARRAGSTWVQARFGDHASFTSVHVYERVASPEGVRAGQHVAVSLRLVAGEIRRWPLPPGLYFLAMGPETAGGQRPRLAVVGADCKAVLAHLECFSRQGATVFAFDPRDPDHGGTSSGTLTVWRLEDP